MTVRTIRQYVPAYRADNGNVIPIGSTTVSAHFAEIEAESLRSPEDETEVFVAYRDLPVWQPLDAAPITLKDMELAGYWESA